ncbi:probable protein S-acyltransferase 15 isoform X1 [Gastrolobium bilobum]|uniref:probable protein S-acyltransferase 15 isoform X1 n=1 Tax=Gastrolobium bilobum TaxID=150636 RepID=UPI002AB16F5C|nr:probable protein S-acyltransferase 15 isoform X1 [Gastrolobium bilobum]
MVMKGKRFLSLPVLAVLLSMFFVYYTTIFVFLDDWVGLQSSPGTLNFSIFTVFASLCLFSFFVCVFTDPGRVPSSYVPDVEARTHDFAKDRAEGKKCDKCFAYKPPRTHHCRVCRRCILKMDHHCLWINNCVGYWNYKAFFAFTLYASVASAYSTVLFISCVLQKDWEPIKGSSLKLFYVMYGLMVVALTITLSTLSGWHVYLILHNMSTIEYYEGNRAKWLAMKSGQSYRHPFNIGAYKNITLILGPNMLKWLCPTAVSHLKDGVSFPTSRDNS